MRLGPHHVRALEAALSRARLEPSVGALLGISDQARIALRGWQLPGATRDRRLRLLLDAGVPHTQRPRALRSPVDGSLVPVQILVCEVPPTAHASVLARNETHPGLKGSLGAILRLNDEPTRLVALTAGHVCGAGSGATRGDLLQFRQAGAGQADTVRGVLLDWEPNFQRLQEGCDFDAGIAEIDPSMADRLAPTGGDLPTGSATANESSQLRLRTRGREITGRGIHHLSVTLNVSGAGSAYLVRNAFAWQTSEETVIGDSGAPVWNENDELVGIHIGGTVHQSQYWAFTAPINPILNWVRSTVVTRGERAHRFVAATASAPTGIGATTSLDTSGNSNTTREIDILARTLWGEARGEGEIGMRAVAHVVFNRIDARRWWGRTVVQVCQKPWQFSCWNANTPSRAKVLEVRTTDVSFRAALRIAADVLEQHASGRRSASDPTAGATHYYAPGRITEPRWAIGLQPCARIGRHVFYSGVA